MHVDHNFESELSLDVLALGGFNPWIAHNSSSRLAMFTGHLGSMLSVVGRTKPRSRTGVDREYAKYTFSIKMPAKGSIIRVIKRYPKRPGDGYIAENPQTIVIYEDVETKRIGHIDIRNFHSTHQQFGFPYKFNTRNMEKIHRGATINEGTIFADSPNVSDDGDYWPGIESEVALLTLPAVIEDAVAISDEYAKKLTTKAYVTHILKWGKGVFPLNLYGDPNDPTDYKIMPDIGEHVRDDGLLFALRTFNPMRAIVEMTPDACRELDYFFDKPTYVEPNAKVVDIKVHYDANAKMSTPVGMEKQPMKYGLACSQFYAAIADEERRLRAQRKDNLRLTPAFHNLVVEALAEPGVFQGQRVIKTHRMVPLDDFRIEITLEYDLVPTIGYKITDFYGKGFIVT